jgi:hypothetical protein
MPLKHRVSNTGTLQTNTVFNELIPYFVGAGTVQAGPGNTVSVPLGVVAGDLLLVFSISGGAMVTPPGWTAVATSTPGTLVWRKFAGVSETAAPFITESTTSTVMLAYRNVLGVDNFTQFSGVIPLLSPSVTTSKTNNIVIQAIGLASSPGTAVADPATTTRVNFSSTGSFGGFCISDEVQTYSGPSQRRRVTGSTITTYNTVLILNTNPSPKIPVRFTANNIQGQLNEVAFSQLTTSSPSGSLRFDGSTGNLSISNDFTNVTTTRPFTWECWVYPTTQLNGTGILAGAFPGSGGIPYALMGSVGTLGSIGGSNLAFGYYTGSGWFGALSSTSLTLNTWSHIAAAYNGTVLTLYLNGTSIATATTSWYAGAGSGTFYIGRRWDTFASTFFTGNISNVRYVAGTAVYTSNFTPPTSPLTAISGTQLLLNTTPSQPFVDSSSNNFTISVTGSVTSNTLAPVVGTSITTRPANLKLQLSNTRIIYVAGQFDEVTGLTASPSTVSPVVDSSLQLWYDAGQSASYPGSGSTWTDLSGKNNTGTLVGSPAYSSADGGSIVFNGTSNEVTTTTFFTNPATFSIGVWFKTSVASGKKLIGFQVTQTGSSSNYDRMIYMGTDGKLYFGVYDGSTNTAVSPLTYNNNVWHYALATYGGEGSTMRLYVDGQSVATATATTAENYNGYWRIGAFNVAAWPGGASSGYFSGNISIAQVYSRSLTSAEVLQNFNAVRGRYGI